MSDVDRTIAAVAAVLRHRETKAQRLEQAAQRYRSGWKATVPTLVCVTRPVPDGDGTVED